MKHSKLITLTAVKKEGRDFFSSLLINDCKFLAPRKIEVNMKLYLPFTS